VPRTARPAAVSGDHSALLQTLMTRFERYPERHPDLSWGDVLAAIERHPSALGVLQRMEETDGEPDVVALGQGAVTFCDCAAESPAGRRSLCYDREARLTRKEAAPAGSAVEMAADIGVELMNEAQYHALQRCGAFDRKTSSWLATPDALRALGGSLFGDRRYDRVFVYHNGAQSYYAARGFRGVLRL
jgi:hypothetical protein